MLVIFATHKMFVHFGGEEPNIYLNPEDGHLLTKASRSLMSHMQSDEFTLTYRIAGESYCLWRRRTLYIEYTSAKSKR